MNLRHILVANVFFAPFSYGGATVVAEQVATALIKQGAIALLSCLYAPEMTLRLMM
ncbi:hypothetical protein ACFQDZ_12370 [Sulfitobacter pacificus]|uniref:hypothetical protein n=1 Tax=Sulfitobacter pacificus TaxID=1499314 RepID=UPI003607BA35